MKWVIMERGACGKTLEPRPRRAPVSLYMEYKRIYWRSLYFARFVKKTRAKSNFMLFNMYIIMSITAKSTRFSWISILSVRREVMILRKLLITDTFSAKYLTKTLTSDISHKVTYGYFNTSLKKNVQGWFHGFFHILIDIMSFYFLRVYFIVSV